MYLLKVKILSKKAEVTIVVSNNKVEGISVPSTLVMALGEKLNSCAMPWPTKLEAMQ